MSGKSRRRGRHLSRSQRKRLGHDVSPLRPAAAAPVTPTTAAPAAVSQAAPPPQTATAPAARAAVRTLAPSSNVASELKRIGVVGGIMLLLMVAAYFVLPLFWA
jgi:hypothetical protein